MSDREFQIEDQVIYYREPSDKEWMNVGRIEHVLKIGHICKIKTIAASGSLRIEYGGKTYEWLPKEAFKLVSEDDTVLKGSYIVTLDGNFIGTDCAKKNFCFKQRVDSKYINPVRDMGTYTTNGNSNYSFDRKKSLFDWRYATQTEIQRYEEEGKPYDVTITTIEKFVEGQYIVTLEGSFASTNCAKKNYCFKVRETHYYLRPCVDLTGSQLNGDPDVRVNKSHPTCTNWRFATANEVDYYNTVAKPFDVTSLCTIKPLRSSNLIKGQIYKLRDEYLFVSGGGQITEYYISIKNKFFHKGGSFGAETNYFDATPEEKNWINTCIQENEYVNPGDALTLLKNFNKKNLEKAKKDYPIGTYYLDVLENNQFQVDIEPEPYTGNEGAIIGHNGGGLLYEPISKKWATIIPAFKIDDWVTVLDTKHVRTYSEGKAIGHTFQITDPYGLETFLKGNPAVLDSKNRYSTNYQLGDIRPATSSEITTAKKADSYTYKFKVGDKVVVVSSGSGIGPHDKGKKCTITALGEYSDSPGYKIDPPMGNTATGSYSGFIDETMFKLDNEDGLKIGDYVEIDNLLNSKGQDGRLSGILGHKGKIVSRDSDGMFRLEPTCIGSCWHEHNLRKIDSPKITMEPLTVPDMTKALASMYVFPDRLLTISDHHAKKFTVPHMDPAIFEWEIKIGTTSSEVVKPIMIPVKKI